MSFVPPHVTPEVYGYMLGTQMRSGDGNKALAEWKAYAKSLEEALRGQKIESRRQFSIKEAALKEIARIDPNNPMLKVEVRKAIGDKAEEELKKSGKLD